MWRVDVYNCRNLCSCSLDGLDEDIRRVLRFNFQNGFTVESIGGGLNADDVDDILDVAMIGILEPVEILHFFISSRMDGSVLCLNRSDFCWFFSITDEGLSVGLLI